MDTMNDTGRIRGALLPIVTVVAAVISLEVAVVILKPPAHLLPAPSAVLYELVYSLPNTLPHLSITTVEAFFGFALGNVAAALFAVAFSQVRLVRVAVYPVFIALQAVPIIAIAPFVGIWFGTGLVGKAAISALICYFPATVIMTDALLNVNRDGLKFMQSMGASQLEVFRHLAFPTAVPSVLAALQVSSTLCFVGAIVAELSGADSGIGFLILKASYEYRTSTLFALLILISAVTVTFYLAVATIARKVARRFTIQYASQ